jgi:hypothetical protein
MMTLRHWVNLQVLDAFRTEVRQAVPPRRGGGVVAHRRGLNRRWWSNKDFRGPDVSQNDTNKDFRGHVSQNDTNKDLYCSGGAGPGPGKSWPPR